MQNKLEPTIPQSFFKGIRLNRLMLNIIFSLALALLLAVSYISYKQVKDLVRANNWVNHTYEVMQTTNSVLYNIVHIESLQRGYLLTGAQSYLSDFDKLKEPLNDDIDKLLILTTDHPEQNVRVKTLNELINERLNLLNQVTQLKFSNKLQNPEDNDFLYQGQNVSTRLKALGQEIKAVELALLKERNHLVNQRSSSVNMFIIIGSILSIAFLIFSFILINSELAVRRKTERNNNQMQTRLRSIIESAGEMIAAFDNQKRFTIFNDAYQKEFKILFDRLITKGASLEEMFKGLPESKQALIKTWEESLNEEEYTKTFEVNEPYNKKVYEITSNLVQNEQNEIDGKIQIIRNITNRVQEHTALLESYEKLEQGMKDLQNKNKQITLLVEMSDIMLACSSQEELTAVMGKYSERMLHFASGYLYIMHPSKNYLELAIAWGQPNQQDPTFQPDQCWAIRLGRVHTVDSRHNQLICEHIKTTDNALAYLCIPLMAQNDIYGLLYMESASEEAFNLNADQRLIVKAFAELTALALANVRLRENLRHQSIRDPLTGLYNRRYLEDFLFKQLSQAERTGSTLAVLMLDLDHFKKINDTFGHDAGDAALVELGNILQADIRMGDVAARYGGEEFIVILYNIDLNNAKIRAEQIRQSVSKLQIKYGAQHVGHITISIGIALYPQDGKTSEELIEAADKALYQAKNNGRNRIEIYSEMNKSSNLTK